MPGLLKCATFAAIQNSSRLQQIANGQEENLYFLLFLRQACYKILNETRVSLLSLLASYTGFFLSPLASKAYWSLRIQDGLLSLYSLCA